MSKRKKIVIAAFILCAIYLFYKNAYLNYNPLKEIMIDTPSFVTDMDNGNRIIVDKSRKRFYKVTADNKITFINVPSSINTKKSFSEIDNLVTDTNGTIYLLDITRKDGGRRISKERILKYSPKGEFIKVLYEINHEDTEVYKNEINRLDMIANVLYFYQLSDDSFQVRTIEGIQKEYVYKDAKLMLVDFSMNPITREIAFIDKSGEILIADENNEYSSIYNGAKVEHMSIPWGIAYDIKGNLYWTDIGTRMIYKVANGVISPYIMCNSYDLPKDPSLEEIKLCPIYYRLHAYDNLVTTDSYGVISANNICAYESAYKISTALTAMIILTWLVLLIGILILVVFLVWFMKYLLKRSSSTFKVIFALLAGTIGFTILFTMLMLQNWNSRMTNEMLKRTAAASQLASQLIDAKDLRSIDSIDDYMNENFKEINNRMENSLKSNEDWSESLYYVIYKIQEGMITTVMATENYTGAIYPYDWPYEDSVEQQVIEDGISVPGVNASAEGTFLYFVHPITDSKTGENVGIMEVGTDSYAFERENKQIILNFFINAIVISIIIILTAFEILIFGQARNHQKELRVNKNSGVKPKISSVSIYRILVFLIFFVTNMTRGFFPLYIMDLIEQGDQLLGLSKELLIAIPMSVEVLFGAIMSLGGNKVIVWMGRRKAAIAGSILFIVGLGLRAVFPSILFLIIGNAIMGCGWGILLLIVQVSIAEKNDDEKNEGFAGYTASSLSGVNCGVVFGAFLINWISFRSVFIVVAALSALSLVFVIMFIRNTDKMIAVKDTILHHEKGEISTLRFLTSPKVLIYFVAVVMPVVASGYFLSYLYPIIAAGYNISETNIGYSLLLNGVCVICFGSMLTKYFASKYSKKITLAMSSSVYIIAFVLFAFYQNIPMLMLTIIILGISDSFGLPMQASYYTDLGEVKRYGYERSMGVFSLIENTAQTFGSFIFGYVLIIGVKSGLIYISIVLAVCTVLFIITGSFNKKRMKV